ncbi:MAG: hypothetical protein ACRC5A_09855 [Enterobacteriaceae bacterium]
MEHYSFFLTKPTNPDRQLKGGWIEFAPAPQGERDEPDYRLHCCYSELHCRIIAIDQAAFIALETYLKGMGLPVPF